MNGALRPSLPAPGRHTLILAAVLLLAACEDPPAGSPPAAGARGPFASSQVKPPASYRGALHPLPRRAERLTRQRAYFQGAEHDPARKAEILGPEDAILEAGARELRAGAIPHHPLHLAAGRTVTLETRRLSPGSDTVLHLWSREAQREVARDDDGGAEPGASRLVFRAPASGSYLVLLRAYAALDDGTCDLLLDGTPLLAGAKFGGATLPVAAQRELHAVLLGDGRRAWPPAPRPATDTLLLLLDPAGGALRALDDDSGIELGSRLATGDRPALALLGAFRAEAEGDARLVVNDAPVADADGDGLGDALEDALCLCARGEAVSCGFDCRQAQSPQDTDGDGLSDAEELLGREHPAFPQLLPRWGADPRHKDLFVEIDLARWTETLGEERLEHHGRTLSVTDAHAAARAFAGLTAMGNPDGRAGIRLHLDLGHPCGSGPTGIDEVCGELCAHGEDGVRRCGQSTHPGPPTERLATLAAGRQHLFHLALADCLVAGQAPAGPADHLEYDCDRFTALVHELGHNLGLAHHYGTFTTGGGNCKPNYPSLMNYAYSDAFAGGRELQFSTGSLHEIGDLDPASLDETIPWGGAGADVSWLAARPFFFELHDCVAPGRGCRVDFNRDGRLDPAVRAHLSPMPGYGHICEGDHGNALGSENIGELAAAAGAAGAELPRRREDGSLLPALHAVAPTSDGTTAALHLDHTFAESGGWQGWRPLDGPALRADAQPAAAVTGAGEQSRLWIFACTAGMDPLRFTTVDVEGQAAPWAPLPDQPPQLACRDASATTLGEALLLVLRDDHPAAADRVLLARWSPAGWSGPLILTVDGAPLRSTVTPALAAAPDGRIYLVTGDPDPAPGTGPIGRIHLYSAPSSLGCAGQTELVDEELAGLRFADGVPGPEHVLWSRPALAFAPHLDGAGEPLAGGRGYLALWWTRGTRTRHLWTWGQLDAAGASFSLGRWHHYEAHGYTDAIAGSSPALALRQGGQLVALLAQSDLVPYRVRHVPHADGAPPGTLVLRDHDDRPTIRQSLCLALNRDCPDRCGQLTGTCAAPPPAATAEVSCSLPRWELP